MKTTKRPKKDDKPVVTKALTKRQVAKKKEEQEKKEREERLKREEAENDKIVDKAALAEAEKARAKKMMEESEARLAEDLFGADSDEEDAEAKVSGVRALAAAENADMDGGTQIKEIEKIVLVNNGVKEYDLTAKSHYKKFAEEVSTRLVTAKSPADTTTFCLSLLTRITEEHMEIDDLNTIKKHLNTIYNKKNEESKKKKSKGGKKGGAQLKLGSSGAKGLKEQSSYDAFGDY